MFRVVGDLPVVAKVQKPAPVAIAYSGDRRSLAPIAKINIFANYQNNSEFNSKQVDLGLPILAGLYYRIDLNYPVSQIQLSFFNPSDPLSATPGQFWIDSTTLNLYAASKFSENLTLTTSLSTVVPVPISTDTYVIKLPGDLFTIQYVEFQGLRLAASEIQLNNNELVISSTRLEIGSDILVRGVCQFSAESLTNFLVSAIATFDLFDSGIVHLDGVDYMGINFIPSINAFNPKIGEFFWDDATRRCSLFISYDQSLGLVSENSKLFNYSSNVSQLSF